jgi:hypothetical protein
MSEEMRCSVCKKDVEPEIDDGSMSYCPICHTGYHNISYEALMREQADEAAVLSEFENETHPYLSRQLTQRAADGRWACRNCGRENDDGFKFCSRCNTARR